MLGKDANKILFDEFTRCRKELSDTYDLLMRNTSLTVNDKLELNNNFKDILWNLDDLIWTFDPNKP